MQDIDSFAEAVEAIEGKKLSRTGRKTAARIVQAAYDILRTEGYEQLSMQGIARRLGIRLSNVQYYFKSRQELIRAVMNFVEQSYTRQYEELQEQAGDDPEDRFRAVVEFNFQDIGNNDTRHFFIQLWPLLSTADDYTGELMQQLYETQINLVAERIQEMVPEISKAQARIRAEIIAAMIEGFMVTSPASVDTAEHRESLRRSVIQTSLAIAKNPPFQ